MTVELTPELFALVTKLVYPDGGNIWIEKFKGDLSETLDGYSVQFFRDYEQIKKLQYSLSPDRTELLDENDAEFQNPTGVLTDEQRRGRLKARWRLLFAGENRIATMEDVLHVSGFPDAKVRTLGWYSSAESPFDFFPNAATSMWGSGTQWGAPPFIWGKIAIAENDFLLTNGGSVQYVDPAFEALAKLEEDPDFWADYIIVEKDDRTRLQIDNELRETFFDLLYLLKPVDSHIILRAEFV